MAKQTMADFTDKELADMVRRSIYLSRTTFGPGEMDSRFMVVLAVPYGNDESVYTLGDALQGFHDLVADDDWNERTFQVYDNEAEGGREFSDVRMEDLEYEKDIAEEEGRDDE